MNNRILLFAVAASLGCVNVVASNVYDGTDGDNDISKSIDLNPVVVTGNGHHQLLKSNPRCLPSILYLFVLFSCAAAGFINHTSNAINMCKCFIVLTCWRN